MKDLVFQLKDIRSLLVRASEIYLKQDKSIEGAVWMIDQALDKLKVVIDRLEAKE